MSLVQVTRMLTSLVTDAIQAGGGVAGVLNGTKMILFTNNFNPTEDTLLADLTPPVDANLATPAALTWSAAHRDAAGRIETETGLISWVPANASNPCTVYGYGITDGAGTNLIAAERFDTPQIMTDTLSYLGVIARWSPTNLDPGTCTVVN